MGSTWGVAKLLGLPEDQLDRMSLLRNWRKKAKGLCLIPPKFVTSGPMEENVDTGNQVDILKFPSPRFHEQDRSRYIGTACAVIQKDPDEGWVNIGTYRVMVVDRNRVTLHATEGQHGGIIMYEKYFARGNKMPVAVVMGADPALYWASVLSRYPGVFRNMTMLGGLKASRSRSSRGHILDFPCQLVLKS